MQPRCRRALLLSAPSCREIVGFSSFYYYFFSWTRRVKSDILSRASPQPLLLCNCCSGGTGPARSRPPPSFRAEGFFPHRPPPSGSGVCVRALTVCSHLLLLTAPPKSLAHVPSALSRAGHRPRLASPITISPNWVLSYLHIWLLWDHGWGRVGGSPPPPSNPQARPCASPPVESLGPKSALCFYSYFVWICKIAKFWSLPCGVWLESSVYNKVLLP